MWTEDPRCSGFIPKDLHPPNLEGLSGQRAHALPKGFTEGKKLSRANVEQGFRAVCPQLPPASAHLRKTYKKPHIFMESKSSSDDICSQKWDKL